MPPLPSPGIFPQSISAPLFRLCPTHTPVPCFHQVWCLALFPAIAGSPLYVSPRVCVVVLAARSAILCCFITVAVVFWEWRDSEGSFAEFWMLQSDALNTQSKLSAARCFLITPLPDPELDHVYPVASCLSYLVAWLVDFVFQCRWQLAQHGRSGSAGRCFVLQ